MKTPAKLGIVLASLALALAACTTPTPTSAPPRELTMSDNGATVELAVGGVIVLKLDGFYDWSVSVADRSVMDRMNTSAAIQGQQGFYSARKPGTTILSATGDPACRKSTPPCAAASVLVQVTVVVK